MGNSSEDMTNHGNQLQEAIVSALTDHRALSTSEVASIVEADKDTVREQLHRMANIGQIEQRKTVNQDVWLTWKL